MGTTLSLLLHAVWAIPGVLIIRCLRPWRTIRLGTFSYSRIGHFVADVGHQWSARRQRSVHTIDLYWLPTTTCNTFWETMVRRNFPVHAWVHPLYRWNRIIPGGAVHDRPSSTTGSRDIHGLLEKGSNTLPFLPEEDERGKAWLRQQGWRDGEPFVCLLVRDSAFLKADTLNDRRDWNYHSYRDSDIDAYVPAVEWLAEQDVWVLRMGKIAAKPIPIRHPRVVDYAFHPDRSDFLDIWLFAHCRLCISTGCGPDMVSDVYRRPLLLVNFLPLKYMFSWSQATHIPKTLIWKRTGLPLTWREHICHSYLETEQYDRAGIKMIDLTPEELRASFQETWQRLEGSLVETDADRLRNRRFWDILRSYCDFEDLHGWIHPESRAGSVWLRSQGEAFLS
ncbi:MAG TPA: TIGR04372 family glycosyltransferase [Syntrophales bacterium]|nr:TIGR04372 family glycosyltransferase [Syntrophales bacterium]